MTYPEAPRVMYYIHDTFGIGHLKRTLTLSRSFKVRWPALAQLIVTGCPVAQNFFLLDDVDYVKLPSAREVERGQVVPYSLPIPIGEIGDLRRDLLLTIVRGFRPDVLIVDRYPAGLQCEMTPGLRYLKESSPGTRLVLGLRDIVDEAPRVGWEWARDGVYELLDQVYDLILVYGEQEVYDVAEEYALSARAAAKVRYMGYLCRPPTPASVEQARASLGLETDRLVLVTAGGGLDGYDLLHAMLVDIQLRPQAAQFDCLLVGGPLMPAGDREQLMAQIPPDRPVLFLDYVQDLDPYMAAADIVVSMGGYNTMCEILSLERPAVIVPRVKLRTEQLMRAEALSRRGLVRLIHPSDLTPGRLLEEVNELLEHPGPLYDPPARDGLRRVENELEALLWGAGT